MESDYRRDSQGFSFSLFYSSFHPHEFNGSCHHCHVVYSLQGPLQTITAHPPLSTRIISFTSFILTLQQRNQLVLCVSIKKHQPWCEKLWPFPTIMDDARAHTHKHAHEAHSCNYYAIKSLPHTKP